MPFTVESERPLARSLRAVGKALAEAARDDLVHLDDDPVAAVHDARRVIRSLRAVLKLVRPALDGQEYRRQNEMLRRASGLLSAHRDAHVLATALEKLLASDPPHLDGLDRSSLADFRESLDAASQHTKQPLTSAAAAALEEINRFDAALDRWPRKGCLPEFAAGFRKTLRRAKRAVRRASANPAPDTLHILRKRTKDARSQFRVLMPLAPKRFSTLEQLCSRVCSLLGESRDQFLLAEACGRCMASDPALRCIAGVVREAALRRSDALAAAAIEAAHTATAYSPRKLAGRLLAR